MTKGRDNRKEKKGANLFALVLIFATLFPAVIYAQTAQSVIITAPTNARISEQFTMRDRHPVTGELSRPHRGTDYAVPCGTGFDARGGGLSCRSQGSVGYGNYGDVQHQCGVIERYGHLQSCNAATGHMVSGNTGGSTGCHLHYEIRINGVAVDPQVAFGQNLCDPAVQAALIADAQQKLNGLAAGGGNAGGNAGGGGVSPIVAPLPATTDNIVLETENGDNPQTSCDTEVWRSMVNLAVLQTRREMVLNETFIAKPDSVLAYACFPMMFQRAGESLGIFSESTRWRNRQISTSGGTTMVNVELGQNSLDGAISNTTLSAYETYMEESFDHDFLGGTGGAPNGPQDYAGCGTMAQVWQAAKCKNVPDGTFPSFAELIDNDPRAFPAGYECDDTGITQGMIDQAKMTEVEISPITTRYEIMHTENNNGECFPVIRTGLNIVRTEGEGRISTEFSYPDGLCLTAGCSYQGATEGVMGRCEVRAP